MFFDIVDITTAYVQYLLLLIRISPTIYPSFYTTPFKVLKYVILDFSQTVGEEQRYTNPLRVALPAWLPLDIRLQFFLISVVSPMALATLGLLGIYTKLGYLWDLCMLGALFAFTFGLCLIVAHNPSDSSNSGGSSQMVLSPGAPSPTTAYVLLIIMLPTFIALVVMGGFRLVRSQRATARLQRAEVLVELARVKDDEAAADAFRRHDGRPFRAGGADAATAIEAECQEQQQQRQQQDSGGGGAMGTDVTPQRGVNTTATAANRNNYSINDDDNGNESAGQREIERRFRAYQQRERLSAGAMAFEAVFQREARLAVDRLDLGDVIIQFLFALVLCILALFFLNAIPVKSIYALQSSLIFTVLGAGVMATGVLAAVWGIMCCSRDGRKACAAISQFVRPKFISLLVMGSNFMYTSMVTNFISLIYCGDVVCGAGTRPPHAGSSMAVVEEEGGSSGLFPLQPGAAGFPSSLSSFTPWAGSSISSGGGGIRSSGGFLRYTATSPWGASTGGPTTTNSSSSSSSVGCVACNVTEFPQRCTAALRGSLCTSAIAQSRLVYDPRVACDLVDGYYKAAACIMFVAYVLYVPTLQYLVAKFSVAILEHEFPLSQRFVDALSPKEQFFEKVITSKNSASFVYRAYKPNFRYYKISFLAQKITLATVSCLTRRGLEQNLSWIGIALFIMVAFAAMAASIALRPFSRPTETIYFPALQATIVFAAVASLYGNSRVDSGGMPNGLAIVVMVIVIIVPVVTLIVATVLTLRMERRRYELLRQRLVKSFASRNVLRGDGEVGGLGDNNSNHGARAITDGLSIQQQQQQRGNVNGNNSSKNAAGSDARNAAVDERVPSVGCSTSGAGPTGPRNGEGRWGARINGNGNGNHTSGNSNGDGRSHRGDSTEAAVSPRGRWIDRTRNLGYNFFVGDTFGTGTGHGGSVAANKTLRPRRSGIVVTFTNIDNYGGGSGGGGVCNPLNPTTTTAGGVRNRHNPATPTATGAAHNPLNPATTGMVVRRTKVTSPPLVASFLPDHGSRRRRRAEDEEASADQSMATLSNNNTSSVFASAAAPGGGGGGGNGRDSPAAPPSSSGRYQERRRLLSGDEEADAMVVIFSGDDDDDGGMSPSRPGGRREQHHNNHNQHRSRKRTVHRGALEAYSLESAMDAGRRGSGESRNSNSSGGSGDYSDSSDSDDKGGGLVQPHPEYAAEKGKVSHFVPDVFFAREMATHGARHEKLRSRRPAVAAQFLGLEDLTVLASPNDSATDTDTAASPSPSLSHLSAVAELPDDEHHHHHHSGCPTLFTRLIDWLRAFIRLPIEGDPHNNGGGGYTHCAIDAAADRARLRAQHARAVQRQVGYYGVVVNYWDLLALRQDRARWGSTSAHGGGCSSSLLSASGVATSDAVAVAVAAAVRRLAWLSGGVTAARAVLLQAAAPAIVCGPATEGEDLLITDSDAALLMRNPSSSSSSPSSSPLSWVQQQRPPRSQNGRGGSGDGARRRAAAVAAAAPRLLRRLRVFASGQLAATAAAPSSPHAFSSSLCSSSSSSLPNSDDDSGGEGDSFDLQEDEVRAGEHAGRLDRLRGALLSEAAKFGGGGNDGQATTAVPTTVVVTAWGEPTDTMLGASESPGSSSPWFLAQVAGHAPEMAVAHTPTDINTSSNNASYRLTVFGTIKRSLVVIDLHHRERLLALSNTNKIDNSLTNFSPTRAGRGAAAATAGAAAYSAESWHRLAAHTKCRLAESLVSRQAFLWSRLSPELVALGAAVAAARAASVDRPLPPFFSSPTASPLSTSSDACLAPLPARRLRAPTHPRAAAAAVIGYRNDSDTSSDYEDEDECRDDDDDEVRYDNGNTDIPGGRRRLERGSIVGVPRMRPYAQRAFASPNQIFERPPTTSGVYQSSSSNGNQNGSAAGPALRGARSRSRSNSGGGGGGGGSVAHVLLSLLDAEETAVGWAALLRRWRLPLILTLYEIIPAQEVDPRTGEIVRDHDASSSSNDDDDEDKPREGEGADGTLAHNQLGSKKKRKKRKHKRSNISNNDGDDDDATGGGEMVNNGDGLAGGKRGAGGARYWRTTKGNVRAGAVVVDTSFRGAVARLKQQLLALVCCKCGLGNARVERLLRQQPPPPNDGDDTAPPPPPPPLPTWTSTASRAGGNSGGGGGANGTGDGVDNDDGYGNIYDDLLQEERDCRYRRVRVPPSFLRPGTDSIEARERRDGNHNDGDDDDGDGDGGDDDDDYEYDYYDGYYNEDNRTAGSTDPDATTTTTTEDSSGSNVLSRLIRVLSRSFLPAVAARSSPPATSEGGDDGDGDNNHDATREGRSGAAAAASACVSTDIDVDALLAFFLGVHVRDVAETGRRPSGNSNDDEEEEGTEAWAAMRPSTDTASTGRGSAIFISEADSAAAGVTDCTDCTDVLLLRCHYIIRQREQAFFLEEKDALLKVQLAVNEKINVMVGRLLTFLFLALGIFASLALALTLTGMLNTIDAGFVPGYQSDPTRSGSLPLELVGYGSWAEFTEHCCCTAATSLDAAFPRYILDVEEWLCDNGVIKERVRRDGFEGGVHSGYDARPLCGMDFINGCELVVERRENSGGYRDAGTVALVGCGSGVSAESRERW